MKTLYAKSSTIVKVKVYKFFNLKKIDRILPGQIHHYKIESLFFALFVGQQ